MNKEEYSFIQEIIGYQFKNPGLLLQAFTRKSYSEEMGGENNEVLEFIGDKVLDQFVVKFLSNLYGSITKDEDGWDIYTSDYDEGELTGIKSKLVQRRTLAHRIDLLGFPDYLFMGQSDINNKINEKESVKEDLFESIIGAVTIDAEWNYEVIERVIENMLEPEAEMENDDEYDNYIGLIQNWAIKREGELPHYKMVPNMGWRTNNGIYIYGDGGYSSTKKQCELRLPGLDKVFVGFDENEHEARYNAARVAYEYLVEKGLLIKIRDEIDDPDLTKSIGQLETLARRGYFSIPVYDYAESYDDDGNPIWTVECMIAGIDGEFVGVASSKKTAKKQAAYKMLMRVLNDD